MTPPDESGVYQRVTTPPAALPVESVNTAQTVPVPRDRVAEFKTVHASRAEDLRRYDTKTDALDALIREMTAAEVLLVDRWAAGRGD